MPAARPSIAAITGIALASRITDSDARCATDRRVITGIALASRSTDSDARCAPARVPATRRVCPDVAARGVTPAEAFAARLGQDPWWLPVWR